MAAVHAEEIREWCLGWNISPELTQELPEMGVVARGLACAFLYRTDSPLCLIDALLTAPGASDAERDAAVDAVVTALFDIAAHLGFTKMGAYTAIPAVVERAERHGFEFVEPKFAYGVLDLTRRQTPASRGTGEGSSG